MDKEGFKEKIAVSCNKGLHVSLEMTIGPD